MPVMDEESNTSLLASFFESTIRLWNPREPCSKIGETIFVSLEGSSCFPIKYVVVDSIRAASTVPQVLIVNECPHGLHNKKLNVDIEQSDFETPSLKTLLSTRQISKT